MFSERRRLLLLLVLLAVVAIAGWTDSRAAAQTGDPTVSTPAARVTAPPAAPTSGEPDVGQTPHPVTSHGGLQPVPRGERGGSQDNTADVWVRWIIRVWAIRYLGAR